MIFKSLGKNKLGTSISLKKHPKVCNTEAWTMLQKWEYRKLLKYLDSLFKKPWESPQAYCQGSHFDGDSAPKLSKPVSMWLFSEEPKCANQSSHIDMLHVRNQRPKVKPPGKAPQKTWFDTLQLLRRTSSSSNFLTTRDQRWSHFCWEKCWFPKSSWGDNTSEAHLWMKVNKIAKPQNHHIKLDIYLTGIAWNVR